MGPNSIFRSYDIGKLLDRKYTNAEAGTAAQTLAAQAGMLDAQSGARRVDPQNALNTAQAGLFGAQAEAYPEIAGAQIGETRANTRGLLARAVGEEQINEVANPSFIGTALGRGMSSLRPTTTLGGGRGLSFGSDITSRRGFGFGLR